VTREEDTSLSLLQRIREGDNTGWRRVVELYEPLARYWCRRWGIQGADADDVIQEAFAAASEAIGTFRRDREGDSFRSWLRAITRNRALAHWRHQRREVAGVGGTDAQRRALELPEPEADDPEEAAEFSALVRRALEQLRGQFEPKTWMAFWRTAVDEQPSPEVAAELGMTSSAVRMAKSRVLHRLREELGDLVE